ncbi:MAG: hypothetical protein H6Q43_3092, partial [Deltaproteobacteria bacterium]|nr:hypothetical protein [Deltaproteobacteria bacterium]
LAEKTEEETPTTEEGAGEEPTEITEEEEAAEETTAEADLTETTGKGERGSRKKLTDAEKAEREAKKKAAEEKKARKAGLGDFQNVGYVYDPENLNKKTKDKSPKSAAKIILDEMIPAKVWKVEFPDGATLGTIRLKDQVQKYFYSFKDYLLASGNRLAYAGRKGLPIEEKIERWMKQGGTIEQFKEWAKKYGETMQPIIDAFKGQTSVTGVIGRLQEVLFSGGGTKYRWPEGGIAQISDTLLHESLKRGGHDFMNYSSRRDLYNLISDTWKNLLADENEVLLSEVDIHRRGRNKLVVRAGLPDYRAGIELKKTEDFQQPFGFNGVGFGEEGWINQEERNRVIPAAFDAFMDLAAAIKAPDKGMSLGGNLAVQFANLGHKAHGAAAAYFPAIKTINFTRDNGDGTMSHEWGHALHALASSDAAREIESIISTFYHVYDFEAGARLADDLLSKDSAFLKRMVSSKKQQRIQAVKDEVTRRFEDVVRKETDYYKTAQAMNADYTALKDGYQTIEQFHELLLKAKLMELLATVEDRYKAIWTSEPSKDGNFWYRYDATAFGPMMQPDDYVGYDKGYKGEGQDGTGAVCYLTQLHPDTILDFKLSNIQYEGENPTYISKEGGGINDGVREDGETTLGEVPAASDQGAEGGGEVRGGDVLGGGEGPKGPRVPGRERGSTRSDEGAGSEDVHPAGTGGGLPGAGGGRGNYRITDSTLTDPKSIDVRFNNNLSAIKILKQLERQRTRTPLPVTAAGAEWPSCLPMPQIRDGRQGPICSRPNWTRMKSAGPNPLPRAPTTPPFLSLSSCGSWPRGSDLKRAWSWTRPLAPTACSWARCPPILPRERPSRASKWIP